MESIFLPCQNSILIGLIIYPPQFKGLNISLLSDLKKIYFLYNHGWNFRTLIRNYSSNLTVNWSGIEVFIDSLLVILLQIPSIITCLSNEGQKKETETFGLLLMSIPFTFIIGAKNKAFSENFLSNTTLFLGLFSYHST